MISTLFDFFGRIIHSWPLFLIADLHFSGEELVVIIKVLESLLKIFELIGILPLESIAIRKG